MLEEWRIYFLDLTNGFLEPRRLHIYHYQVEDRHALLLCGINDRRYNQCISMLIDVSNQCLYIYPCSLPSRFQGIHDKCMQEDDLHSYSKLVGDVRD
jgi:hypothetical protein